MTEKAYKPSVKYDPRFKGYVDTIKKETGLHGSQIIRLALFTACHNQEFLNKLRDISGVKEIPTPEWNGSDDNMWLMQHGEATLAFGTPQAMSEVAATTGWYKAVGEEAKPITSRSSFGYVTKLGQ